MNINPTEFKEMELRNCNFVKTVLMILVVLYHGRVFWTEGWFSVLSPDISCKALGVFSKWLNTFHIYGFTLASGYIYYHIRYEKGRYDRFIPFVLNKAKRLLIPYYFINPRCR